jgi:hypothetical protein
MVLRQNPSSTVLRTTNRLALEGAESHGARTGPGSVRLGRLALRQLAFWVDAGATDESEAIIQQGPFCIGWSTRLQVGSFAAPPWAVSANTLHRCYLDDCV